MRERQVLARQRGQGRCPVEDSVDRLQYQRCNEHICEPKHGAVLQCHAKLDVVILLDGSASLGEQGWVAMRDFAAALVASFQDKAQVGLVLYSGPQTMENYKACTSPIGGVDMMNTCKIVWASHFTTSTGTLATNMARLVWPRGTRLTSTAMATAEAELRTGRADAQAIVIVLTAGQPMNRRKTFQAAQMIRRKARLVWVPVTPNVRLEDVKEWASKPVADNVVPFAAFTELKDPRNINKVISSACPIVQ
jgi:hypothetical protein